MSIFDKLKSFSLCRNENKEYRKSAIVYGNLKNTNSSYAILYITKPKNISEEEYRELIDALEINFVKRDTQE